MPSPATDRLIESLQPQLVWNWVASGEEAVRSIRATVISADISGFTRLAESLQAAGPRAAAEMLNRTINECFSPMIDEIEDRGGDVLKFGGDALFALFSGPDSELQASAAAHRLHQLLADASPATTPLAMTVGVATGTVELVLGGSARRELVVYGPTVDTCLQLEDDAEPGETLICDTTAAALPSSWLERDDDVTLLTLPDERELPDPPHRTGPNAVQIVDDVVSPELASAVASFAGTAGELRVVTVAFIDLPLGDVPGERVAEVIDRVDQACRIRGATFLSTDVSRRGCKLMLAAGAPVASDADEDALLGALLDVVHDPSLPPMRAGINRGLLYAGFLGSDRCRTMTVMGDATNLAARLLKTAELGEISVSSPVLDNAQAVYPTTTRQPILVKGRFAPVDVHRLDGPATTARHAAREPDFVGREDELIALRGMISALRRGQGGTIRLAAESGFGLSRLVSKALEELPPGVLRLNVEGRLATPEPYSGVRRLLRGLAGLDQLDHHDRLDHHDQATTSRSALADAVREWVARTDPDADLDAIVPLLTPMLAHAPTAEVAPSALTTTAAADLLRPDFRQQRAERVVGDLLQAALAVPTVIVVSDAHRLDAASLALCGSLADRTSNAPWLMITTSRPDRGVWEHHPQQLLPPMSREQIDQLVTQAGDLPRTRAEIIADQAGGNPGFALELIDADDVESGAMSSVERLVTARIDRLGHDARVLLRTAAVIGRLFDVDVLARVLTIDLERRGVDSDVRPSALSGDLDALHRFLDPVDVDASSPTYSFRTGVVQQVAYSGLSEHRRLELHAAVGHALAERETDAATLAWHASRSGQHQRCWELSRRAADAARALGVMTDVSVHLQRALDAATADSSVAAPEELTALRVELFGAAVAARHYRVAFDVAEQLLSTDDDFDGRDALLVQYAFTRAEVDGDFAAQSDQLTALLEATEPDHHARRAWISCALSSLLYRQERSAEALDAAEASLTAAAAAGVIGPRPQALLIRHAVLADRHDPARHAAGDELIAGAAEADDLRIQIAGHNNIGLDLHDGGEWDGAEAHYRAGLQLAAQIGDGYRRMYSAMNHASLLTDRGEWERGRIALDELRREARFYGGGFHAASVHRELARCEIHAGRTDHARPWLDAARAWYVENDMAGFVYEMDLLSAASALADGNSDAVFERLARLTAPDELTPRLEGEHHRLAGYARLQRAQHAEALEEFERAAAASADVFAYGHALTLLGRARAEEGMGQRRTARRTREQAEATLARLGVVALPYVPLPN